MDKPYDYKFSKEKSGKINIEATINPDYFRENRELAIKKLGSTVEIKGFRKGQVPNTLLENRFGQQANIQVVKKVAFDITAEIVKEKKETVLSPLSVKNIDNYTDGNPVNVAFSFQGAPDIDTKALNSIKLEPKAESSVSDDEVLKVLEEMWVEDAKTAKKELTEGTVAEGTTILGPDGKPIKHIKPKEKEELKFDYNKLSPEWAQKIDPSVKTVDDLKNKVKSALLSRKDQYNKSLYEHNLFDKIAEKINLEIPSDIIETELVNREEEFYSTARMSGISPAEYLRSQNISIDKLRETWKNQTVSGLRQLFIITGIAKSENLVVNDSEVEELKVKDEKPENTKMRVLKQKVLTFITENIKS